MKTEFSFTLAYPNEAIKAMLQRKGHTVHTGVFKDNTDIVVFSGGADVSPFYYGERRLKATTCALARDLNDAKMYREARDKGLACIGICRGAQFLHVMNGGSLWQHVDKHATSNGHLMRDVKDNIIRTTSTHHQMMRGLAGGFAIAWAAESTTKESEEYLENIKKNGYEDLEIVWHPATKSLCFQGHPEYHLKECHDYFFGLLDDWVFPVCA